MIKERIKAMILGSARKKSLFLGAALGSLAVASCCIGEAKASWSAPRCAAQCRAALFAGEKAGSSEVVGLVAPKQVKDRASGAYKKLLNACSANCDNIPIRDALVANYQSLNEENQKRLKMALEDEKKKTEDAKKKLHEELDSNALMTSSSRKKRAILGKEIFRLQGKLNALSDQISKIGRMTPASPEAAPEKPDDKSSQNTVPPSAHPESGKLKEEQALPEIPEIKGFAADPHTMHRQDGRVTLTSWGILKVLQATGIVVDREPGEAGATGKAFGMEDIPKVIGSWDYGRNASFVQVASGYLANGRKQTHYILKTETNPTIELKNLEKVRAEIAPKLSGARYAKIATKAEAAFYVDSQASSETGKTEASGVSLPQKRYVLVLEGVDGHPLGFALLERHKDEAKWREVLSHVGRAVGELHRLLADSQSLSIPVEQLKLESIKTILHGDMRLENMFYNDKDQSITFIDTGAVADSLTSKGSPIKDLERVFGTVKYQQLIDLKDGKPLLPFETVNEDFEHFADGYAKGWFAEDKGKQEKMKQLVINLFKDFSNSFGGKTAAMLGGAFHSFADGRPNAYFNEQVMLANHQLFTAVVHQVFNDRYVSKELKEKLTPILFSNHTSQQGAAQTPEHH